MVNPIIFSGTGMGGRPLTLIDLLERSEALVNAPVVGLTRAHKGRFEHRKRYLQIAFNYDLGEAERIIPRLPRSDKIIVEAGTPFIKRYGEIGIRRISQLWGGKVVADIKTFDGAEMEVEEVARAGATAATVIAQASTQTLDLFIEKCEAEGIDSIIDMIGVEKPMAILRELKQPPKVIVIHRGRDEEGVWGKVIQYKHISKIRSKYDVIIGAAGGIDLKEARSAVFNGADIVIANIVRPEDNWEGISTEENISEKVKEFLDAVD